GWPACLESKRDTGLSAQFEHRRRGDDDMAGTLVREMTAGMFVTGLFLTGLLMGLPTFVFADATPRSDPSVQQDPQYAEGEKAVKRGDYAEAIRLFQSVVAKDSKNADAYNMLAYSIRKSGDAARAIPIYEKALAIDPKHKGAHEY